MILSDRELRDRLIPPEEVTQAKDWWEKSDWGKIGNRILIEPFMPHALGACCYDLSVGEEYISLRDPYTTKKLKKGEHIDVGPGETVLILTQEYVCLPKNVMAMIVPRATWIFEGTSICATRIEPTWFGKLIVAFTNLAKNPIALGWGEGFCTCYWMQVAEVERVLTAEVTSHLGRTEIGTLKFAHARQQKLSSPEKVDREDIEKIVELYGWPWDVVRGMFVLSQKEITEYVEKEIAPAIVEEATSAAIERAFRSQQVWLRILIMGLLTILAFFVAFIGYLIFT